ncbi:TPA: arsenate reductase (glutaredoxin) [Neisseria meningitidis]
MSEIKIFHNPRCSKSRAALSLLEERGIAAEVVKYLDTPPDLSELKDIFNKLGLDNPNLDNDALLRAIADHPALLERPIVLANGKAAVGRPLENIEAVL